MVTLEAVLSKVSDTLAHSPDRDALADYLTHMIDFPLTSIGSDAHLEEAIGKILPIDSAFIMNTVFRA